MSLASSSRSLLPTWIKIAGWKLAPPLWSCSTRSPYLRGASLESAHSRVSRRLRCCCTSDLICAWLVADFEQLLEQAIGAANQCTTDRECERAIGHTPKPRPAISGAFFRSKRKPPPGATLSGGCGSHGRIGDPGHASRFPSWFILPDGRCCRFDPRLKKPRKKATIYSFCCLPLRAGPMYLDSLSVNS